MGNRPMACTVTVLSMCQNTKKKKTSKCSQLLIHSLNYLKGKSYKKDQSTTLFKKLIKISEIKHEM